MAQPEWTPKTFLGGLPNDIRDDLMSRMVKRRFPAGRTLLREGDHGTHVELLISGFVKVTTVAGGTEVLLGIRMPGEIIGEIGALTGQPRTATVTTCGVVIAGVIAHGEFEAFLRRHPEISAHVTATVAQQLGWSNRRRIDFGAYPADVRLARLLADIADMCGIWQPDGGILIGVPLSQSELATMVAVGDATVQKALHHLRARGLIYTGYRRLTVIDIAALRTYSGDLA